MKQSRIDSFMEAAVNIVIGLVVSFIANLVILPAVLGVSVSVGANLLIGCLYTVVSLVRSYTIRRLFNGRSVWESMRRSVRFCAITTIVLSPLVILWQIARRVPQVVLDLSDEYVMLFKRAWTGKE